MAKGRGQQERTGPRRCAIYTRKSTEEGLDQQFNSLDAQREACEAYVQSQKQVGWWLCYRMLAQSADGFWPTCRPST